MFDKNFFLDRLRKGESIDDISQSVADAINEANSAYEAEQAAKKIQEDKKEAKYAIAEKFVDLMREYCELVCPEAKEVFDEVTAADYDDMIAAMDNMFGVVQLTMNLRKPDKKIVKAKSPISDDEILSRFLKELF